MRMSSTQFLFWIVVSYAILHGVVSAAEHVWLDFEAESEDPGDVHVITLTGEATGMNLVIKVGPTQITVPTTANQG